ncbi:MAG: hypothetical protein E7391_05280 [Ruminococcaceae bacterium]|nr:hypothetical protein [Oscillospiraceae bacterium]
MKRIIPLLFIFVFLFGLSAMAKSGDIAGVYYSTDITTTLNGEEIDSINIGGKTLISAEDMHYYGFNVTWLGDQRKLVIHSQEHAENGQVPTIKKSNYPSGNIIGNYYETDIETYLDDKIITSYNIGGRTYIYAEEMMNFDYRVLWDENERTLSITSPKFLNIDYAYSININKEQAQTSEANCAFKINYTKDGTTVSGDYNYFGLSLHSNYKDYYFVMSFYQNGGLFYSGKLRDKLDLYASGNHAVPVMNPEEKYELINQNLKITINGQELKKIAIARYFGNGHVTYYLYINDEVKKYTKDEIESISVTMGNTDGLEEIKLPSENETLYEKLRRSVIKNKLDYVRTSYETDEYFVFNVKESEKLGKVCDRLYLVNKQTGEISNDILEDVRKIEGFNTDKMGVFAISVKAVKNNLFFSCAIYDENNAIKRTGDFYVELDSQKVHFIAKSER